MQGIIVPETEPSYRPEADTDSVIPDVRFEVDGEGQVFIPEPSFNFDVEPDLPIVEENGDSIPLVDPSAVIPPTTGERRSRRTRPEPETEPEDKPEREPKTGPPDITEWMDFFSKVLLRFICDWYINYAFSGVDEDLLSDREIERIKLTSEERKRIARPFAELSYKSKVMRKHGRTIVASGGAFDALVTLGAWTSRVNRIARKYKRSNPKQARNQNHERSGSSQPQANGFDYATGTHGGHVPNGARIVNPYT